MKIHYLKLFLLSALFSIWFSNSANAQKFLQIERKNKVRVKKIYKGDKIIYKLISDKHWREGKIEDILVDDNIIVLANSYFRLDSLESIALGNKTFHILGNQLTNFTGIWLIYGGVALIFSAPVTVFMVAVPATSLTLGMFFKRVLGSKKYKRGKKNRFRLIEISF